MEAFVLEVEASKTIVAIETIHDVFAIVAIGAPINEVAVVIFSGFDAFVHKSGFVEHAGVGGVFHAAGIVHVHAVLKFV